MKVGVEGKEEGLGHTQDFTMSSSRGDGLGVLLPAPDTFVARNPLREEDENSNGVVCRDVPCRDVPCRDVPCRDVPCRESDSYVQQQPPTMGNGVVLEEAGS